MKRRIPESLTVRAAAIAAAPRVSSTVPVDAVARSGRDAFRPLVRRLALVTQ